MTSSRGECLQEIARRAANGAPVEIWLRDDDAVAPGPALDRLLALTGRLSLPLLLAVIPAPADGPRTGLALVRHLAARPDVDLAVHGWSHQNHALAGEKKQELDAHRRPEEVHAGLRAGLSLLQELHGDRALPILVPPWNRIAPGLLPGLGADGFLALSTYGPDNPLPGLRVMNSTLDIMNWKGGRIGLSAARLWDMMAALLRNGAGRIGFLSHHLVHDETAWTALETVLTEARAAGAVWQNARKLMAG